PELEVVEIAPGIFVFDDTAIPDTPEQAEARKRRQEADALAKAIAANPLLAEAERTARQAAQEAVWKANKEKVAPWLVKPLASYTGEPPGREATEAHTRSRLLDLAAQFNAEYQATLETAAKTGTPAELIFPNGERAVLSSFVEGQPLWNMSDSLTQAVSIATAAVWPGGGAGFSLTGTNTPIGLWEAGGIPRLTHQEFQGRVSVGDGTTNQESHATAVASVLNAAGLYTIIYPVGVTNPQAAKGMSYAAPVVSNNSSNDVSEMASQVATNNPRISNHSYSARCGWQWLGAWVWFGDTNVSQTVDWKFGAYTTEAYSIDTNAYAARMYLPVWTPGNSGGEGPPVQPTNHYVFVPPNNFIPVSGVTRSIDGDAGVYDSLHPQGCAKNVLTVGNVSNLVAGYTGPASVRIGPYSPFGPTDDGRLKPDIVAPGTDIIMAGNASDIDFVVGSGTSFAAPAISGSINLLNQLRNTLHPNARPWLASTMKALVIQTADEAGDHPGPDYRFGWGLMNTRRAAELVRNNATNGWKSFLKEIFLPNGGSIEIPVPFAAGQTGRFTIVWTDPAGLPQTNAVIDSPATRLVNDVDMQVIAPSGTTNFPYVLNPDLTNQSALARAAAATTGDDSRNNVEQVVVTNTVTGTYLVRITHKGTLAGGGQWITWTMSGGHAQAKPPLVLSQPSVTASNKLAFSWPSVVGQLYQVQYLNNLEGASWTNWDDVICAISTNTAVEVDMDGPDGRRFYRVVEVE
ncbi:MAG: S8 family serine peptidase, partial [Verrucomicrobiota bacterium]|nr:S8 family serine peptidase [Verrucomicrobiota bacterium]